MEDISVIIPFYKGKQLLYECLDWINNQSLTPHEVIVVNDGEDVLDLNLSSYKFRLILVNNAENKGAAAARNIGVRRAQGTWIAFCDHDDKWLPHKLEEQHRFMSASEVITCNAWVRNESKLTLRKTVSPNQRDILELLLQGWTAPNTSSLVMKKSLFKFLGGFDERLASGQDHDLWFRIAREKAVVHFIDKPLYIFDNSPSELRISSQVRNKLIDLDIMISKYSDSFTTWESLNFISYWEAYYCLEKLLGHKKYQMRCTNPPLFIYNICKQVYQKFLNIYDF